MDYVGRIYRPPSEAYSLLLQVTEGCSHNRCTYCGMYRDKPFRTKSWPTIEADLVEAATAGEASRRVFLCDGDALVLSQRRLLQILEGIRKRLPWVERVGVYGDTRSVNRKTVAELRQLRQLGLEIVYHGVESGNDEVLRFVDKGGTAAECVDTADRLREAEITHSVIVLLGVGGVALSKRHALGTGALLTKMDPPFVAALTTTVIPETPLGQLQEKGAFELPSKFGLLEELHTIVAESELTGCRFSSNHASNYLPVRADLPQDKAKLLTAIRAVIDAGDEGVLRPEWMRGL
ncbi:MAG: radical SAM protein [Deltaproteobacteria bacterium]|nr:MAG: radical SAM protein [Deltaproteobacteria bacterium]